MVRWLLVSAVGLASVVVLAWVAGRHSVDEEPQPAPQVERTSPPRNSDPLLVPGAEPAPRPQIIERREVIRGRDDDDDDDPPRPSVTVVVPRQSSAPSRAPTPEPPRETQEPLLPDVEGIIPEIKSPDLDLPLLP